MTKNVTIAVFFTLSVIQFSCKKSGSDCEKWEYEETCQPKSPLVNCPNYGIQSRQFCGSDVKDANAGRVTVVLDNADVKKTRRYIKKLN